MTTDAPGCREIVIDHINGLLVPVKNSIALADALMQLIEEPLLRQHMGEQGRAIVEAEFSVEKVIEQTLALYRTGLSCKEY